MLILVCSTGLPTQDEALEMTVRNLSLSVSLYSWCPAAQATVSFFAKSINKPLNGFN